MSKRGEKKIVCGTCKFQGIKPHEYTPDQTRDLKNNNKVGK